MHFWNYETDEDQIERLSFFLEEVYNLKRLHSSIGYVLADEFEYNVLKLKPAGRSALNL
jgi:transposase InsO family protein